MGRRRRTHEELGERVELKDLGREVGDLIGRQVERREVLKPDDRFRQPLEGVLPQTEDPKVVKCE